MKEHEIKPMEDRIAAYHKLAGRRAEIKSAMKEITQDWAHGPHGSGPFTSNTRESRQVDRLYIYFTPTRGGSAPVELKLDQLYIEASLFGNALLSMLQAQLAAVQAQIDTL